jgi:hypothetical protein
VSETTATRAPRQRKKQARFCNVHRDENGVRTLTLRIGKKVDLYDLADLTTDYGRGFQLTKADGTTYHVCLDGLASSCDCKGHTRHGRCKHHDALAALEAGGRL